MNYFELKVFEKSYIPLGNELEHDLIERIKTLQS
jgi:hypothetical protein